MLPPKWNAPICCPFVMNVAAFSDPELAARNLAHANEHRSHPADLWVVYIDDDNTTGGHFGNIWLRVVRRSWIWSFWIVETLLEVLRVVRSRYVFD